MEGDIWLDGYAILVNKGVRMIDRHYQCCHLPTGSIIGCISIMHSASRTPGKLRIGDRILHRLCNYWMSSVIGQALIDLMQPSRGVLEDVVPPEHGKRLLVMSFMCKKSIFIRFAL